MSQSTSNTDETARRRLDSRFRGYLLASALSNAGSTMVFLATAILIVRSGGSAAEAARNTSMVFATGLVMSAVSLPYAPVVARRIGSVRALYSLQSMRILVTAIVGVALIIEGPLLPLLLVYAGVVGVFRGLARPLRPPLLKHYAGLSLDKATARNRRFQGVGALIGALTAGLAIDRIGGEPMFLLGPALMIPGVVYLMVRPPENPLRKPGEVKKPWLSLFACIKTSPELRSAIWLGVASAVLLAPLVTMVVPVLAQVGHDASAKAGLVFAALALGQVMTPNVVSWLERRREPFVSATRGVQISAIALLLLSMVAFVPNGPYLLLVIFSTFIFGGVFFSVSAFLYLSATAKVNEGETVEYLAAYMLVTGLAAPIGTLVWGHALGSVPLEVFFLTISVCAALVVPALLRRAVRARHPRLASAE